MWKLIVNGDSSLEYYIQYAENGKNMKSEKLHQDYTNQLMAYTVNGLNPNRKYTFSILAVNLMTESISRTVECLTDVSCTGQEMSELQNEYTGMFVAGIAMLIVGLLIVTAVTGFVVRNSFKNNACESTTSDEHINEQISNPAITNEDNTSYFESRPPQERRIDSENLTNVNTYEDMPTLSKVEDPIEKDSIHPTKTNAYEDMGTKSKVEEPIKMDSIHHTKTNAYEDMGTKLKVKQPLKKTTEKNVIDSNINIYESMKEQACAKTSTVDPLRELNVMNPSDSRTGLYESMKMSAEDNTQTSDLGREIKVGNTSGNNNQLSETVKTPIQEAATSPENKIVDMYTSFVNIRNK